MDGESNNEKIARLTKERDILIELKKATSDLVEQQKLQTSEWEKELELMKLRDDASVTEIATLERKIKRNKEYIDTLKEQVAAGEAVSDGLAGLLGVNKSFEKSMLGSITTLMNSAAAQQKFKESIDKTFTSTNFLYSLTQKVTQSSLQLAMATDSSLVAFNKQTGATRLYGAEIKNLEREMYHHGVGVGEATEALGAMTNNITDLRNISKGSRKELSTTTALLAHMGVSADTTGANVQFMTRSLGVGVGEATKYQRELFSLAQEIGMPPEQMAAGFKAAQPKLAAFGKQAGSVFKKLAVNARAAGMEVEQLLNITEQFDTFEGAAQSVGKLNALLGGPFLNSMEMVTTTDPTERMKLLSGALNDAGKSFDQLTYYEKKSIAAAAGLSDTNELALVMAGSFDATAGGAHKSQAEIEALAKQTKEFNDFAAEMNQMMRMFAMQLEPVVMWLKGVAQWIQETNQALGGYLVPTIIGAFAAIKLLVGGLKIWSFWSGVTATRQMATAVATGASTAAQGAQIPVMIASGTTAGAMATPMLYFAAAALAVGAAFFLIGAGVGVAAYGMSLFMASLIAIPPMVMMQYGPAFLSLAAGMIAVAAGLYLLSPFMPLILGISLGLTLLGWSISNLDFSNLQPVADLFNSMAAAMDAPIENLTKIASAIGQISDAIGTVDSLGGAVVMTQLFETASTSGTGTPGSTAQSRSLAANKEPIKHEITLEFDPRKAAFKDFVIKIVDEKLIEGK
jgi:hypothetical protein